MQHEPLSDRARGRWFGILPMLGVDSRFLTNKHGPCIFCGGRDRWRFDDKEGKGTWICSQCGAGDGVSLVMRVNGWDFKTAAQRIESLIGSVERKPVRQSANPRQQLRAMKLAWAAARPISETTAARIYLSKRGIDSTGSLDLRESGRHEMLAIVRDPQGSGCQVHRTLLTAEGEKAKVDKVRLFMPGPISKGAAVRLSAHEGEIGIAEGIETALSAAILFHVPCWAALNATMLRQWQVPDDVKSVVVFADNDANCTGQASAYELANKLSAKVSVRVEVPPRTGDDWNDVLLAKG